MDKKKRLEIAALPLLAIIFILVMGSAMKKTGFFRTAPVRSGTPPPSGVRAGEASSATAAEIKALARPRRKRPSEELAWGRDPFVLQEAPAHESFSVHDLNLMGITWSADKKAYCAIINNELYLVGSMIGKFKVIEIRKDRVTVAGEKERYELLLK